MAQIRARGARGRKVNSNKAVKLFRSRCAPRAFCRGGAETGNSDDNSATAARRFNKLGGEDDRKSKTRRKTLVPTLFCRTGKKLTETLLFAQPHVRLKSPASDYRLLILERYTDTLNWIFIAYNFHKNKYNTFVFQLRVSIKRVTIKSIHLTCLNLPSKLADL